MHTEHCRSGLGLAASLELSAYNSVNSSDVPPSTMPSDSLGWLVVRDFLVALSFVHDDSEGCPVPPCALQHYYSAGTASPALLEDPHATLVESDMRLDRYVLHAYI